MSTLPSLGHDRSGEPAVSVRTVTRIDAMRGRRPPAVFLLRATGRGASEILEDARTSFPTVPLLGVICASSEQRERLGPLDRFARYDDIAVCPVSSLELRTRLSRCARTRVAGEAAGADRQYVLVGESEAFRAALGRIAGIADCDATVLIQGETGTGKELFARAAHYRGPRAHQPFVPVNCGALPDTLLENELFGHVRGAFTGAATNADGLLREADGGTLFLDEVDSLAPSSQVKLLRFLQDGCFRALGSAKTFRADVRVIAATNADLRARVAAGGFREDLYYRLNVLPMRVPALRERDRDILRLAQHFLRVHAHDLDRSIPALSESLERALLAYRWPGNVRELESFIQRTLVFCPECKIDIEHVRREFDDHAEITFGGESEAAAGLDEGRRAVVERFERTYLKRILADANGNVSQAAKTAGKDRRTIQRMLRKYEFDRRRFRFASGGGADR